MTMKQQHIDEMLAKIERTISNNTFRKLDASTDAAQHPSSEQLYSYAHGELDSTDAKLLRRHLAHCPVCNGKALRIMRSVNNCMPETAQLDELRHDIADWRDKLSNISEAVLWATRLWQPEWAGVTVYASDIPEQQHTFSGSGQEGEIEISCSWRDTYGTTPAYLTISWLANITADRKLWAVFFDPESKDVLAEIPLGKYKDGGKSLTSESLGFNPSREKWAIALLLKTEDL